MLEMNAGWEQRMLHKSIQEKTEEGAGVNTGGKEKAAEENKNEKEKVKVITRRLTKEKQTNEQHTEQERT